ncbi:hypothetical protein AV530_015153 [Patagioenas fasciata monilis]|uniref:Uncharacterized protein n=1 Tax=Patagioenas fasciata monilis TaxID=372326 RepID=A0A1V4K151_PATFA|nr:hypothetical protein AV530_015153 [Patagioenas fasciata monilis]
MISSKFSLAFSLKPILGLGMNNFLANLCNWAFCYLTVCVMLVLSKANEDDWYRSVLPTVPSSVSLKPKQDKR